MAEQNQAAIATRNIGDDVIAKITALSGSGLTLPADYNAVNAIKMSMLKLQDIKDRNGNPALTVCTPNSIATALFKMATQGLNLALSQCYFIVYGKEIQMQPSYFGKILQVKRLFPDWEPSPHTIREGDEFEFAINPKTGHRKLIKHTQTLESMDKDFTGAYVILPTSDGEGDLYVMTKKQIVSAWNKSQMKEHTTAKQFDEKMACKTVVNSGCNTIINATPNNNIVPVDDDEPDEQAQPDNSHPIENINLGAAIEPDSVEMPRATKRTRKAATEGTAVEQPAEPVAQPAENEVPAEAAAPTPASNPGDDFADTGDEW